jgi:hypothetical protein
VSSVLLGSPKYKYPILHYSTVHKTKFRQGVTLSTILLYQVIVVPTIMKETLSVTNTFSTDAGSSTDSSCQLVSNPPSTPNEVAKLEKQRRKLMSLHHAATCKHENGEFCPDFKHCQAMKRLYKHVVNCRTRGHECIVPGCNKLRSVWSHFRRCSLKDCQICSILPQSFVPSPILLQKKDSRNRLPPVLLFKRSKINKS